MESEAKLESGVAILLKEISIRQGVLYRLETGHKGVWDGVEKEIETVQGGLLKDCEVASRLKVESEGSLPALHPERG